MASWWKAGAAAAVLILSCAGAASAEVIDLTVQGTVYNSLAVGDPSTTNPTEFDGDPISVLYSVQIGSTGTSPWAVSADISLAGHTTYVNGLYASGGGLNPSLNLLSLYSVAPNQTAASIYIILPQQLSGMTDSRFAQDSGVTGTGSFTTLFASGLFHPTSLTEQVAPVPEASTWVYMVAGLVAVGAVLARRRHAVAMA